jgi:flagellar biosynthesis protein FliQ
VNVPLAIDLIRSAVFLALLTAAPLLLAALVVGVLISVLQTITQIQEQTLTFIPKLLAMAVVFVLMLPWLLNQLVGYLTGVLRSLSVLVA